MEAGRIGGRGEGTGQGHKGAPPVGRRSALRTVRPEKPIYEGVNSRIVAPPVGRPGRIPVARKKKTGFPVDTTRPSHGSLEDCTA